MSVTLAKTAQSIAAGKAKSELNRRLRANDLVALSQKFSGK